MQVTRSIEERPCLTWPDQGPVGPSGFFREPWWTLPAEGRPVRALEVLPQAFRRPVPILRRANGEVVRIFLVGRDVALLLFSWPSVATLLFLTLLPKLERRPWDEYRPLDLCWRVGRARMCEHKRSQPPPLRLFGVQGPHLKCQGF